MEFLQRLPRDLLAFPKYNELLPALETFGTTTLVLVLVRCGIWRNWRPEALDVLDPRRNLLAGMFRESWVYRGYMSRMTGICQLAVGY